jgi:hypothetical protein
MKYTDQYNIVEGGLVVLAPCKINLSLLIGEKRPYRKAINKE